MNEKIKSFLRHLLAVFNGTAPATPNDKEAALQYSIIVISTHNSAGTTLKPLPPPEDVQRDFSGWFSKCLFCPAREQKGAVAGVHQEANSDQEETHLATQLEAILQNIDDVPPRCLMLVDSISEAAIKEGWWTWSTADRFDNDGHAELPPQMPAQTRRRGGPPAVVSTQNPVSPSTLSPNTSATLSVPTSYGDTPRPVTGVAETSGEVNAGNDSTAKGGK